MPYTNRIEGSHVNGNGEYKSTMLELLERLNTELKGDVDSSLLAQRLYSQDASIYEERPLGVVRPRDRDDCIKLVQFCADHSISLIPRAGGTSLAGQCVGSGLVVDVSRYMTDILEINHEEGWALVQPGVIQDDLNDAVAEWNLQFAPDTSTSKQAMIGGMVGNNSCGAYSILHGTTRDHVLAMEVVLGDGTTARFHDLTPTELNDKLQEDSLEGRIYRTLTEVITKNGNLIVEDYPKPEVKRRNMGYALDQLVQRQPWNDAGKPFSICPLICGSEGTLALITEIKVKLVPRPAMRTLVCGHFESVDEACRATVVALEHEPAAVEMLDGILLEATKSNREQAANRFWIEGDPGCVLAVEFHGRDVQTLEHSVEQLSIHWKKEGMGYACVKVEQQDIPRVWALRKAGLGLLTGIPGDHKPVTAIEDIAVAVSDLPDFIKEIELLMKRAGCECVYYGHASVGVIHLRPMLNLKSRKDLGIFMEICEGAAEITRSYGGSLSGEHGDGRLRGPFVKKMLSPEIYELLIQVKRTFDPGGIFNPNKIVDAVPYTEQLRTHPESRTPDIKTEFDWSRYKGLVRAAESCNGAGFCRQSAGRGTMCPSYMVSKEEAYTTRGRANILRQLLTSENPENTWTNRELTEVLDTCLSCKGCSSECPSNVDMARLKAEVLQKRMDREGVKLRSRLFGNFAFYARLAQPVPELASYIMNRDLSKRFLGVAIQRAVPPFVRMTLAKWFKKHTPHPRAGQKGVVVLFNDEFTNYTDPEPGCAVVNVLEWLGYQVKLTPVIDSGRTQISKGFVRTARAVMEKAVKTFSTHTEEGLAIVGVEPSALLGFRDEAPELVSDVWKGVAEKVSRNCFLFEEFIVNHQQEITPSEIQGLKGRKVMMHGHCHQKSIVGMRPLRQALEYIPGLEIEEIPSGCCGMAGSFGYEKEHYRMSMDIGELVLFPAIREQPEAIICAPGTSCRHQIKEGAGRKALHPAQIFMLALGEP